MLLEGWLMAYNVAYAFERTPFYRPWLSWVGVDLRRLGVEDLVSICTHTLDPASRSIESRSGRQRQQQPTRRNH